MSVRHDDFRPQACASLLERPPWVLLAVTVVSGLAWVVLALALWWLVAVFA